MWRLALNKLSNASGLREDILYKDLKRSELKPKCFKNQRVHGFELYEKLKNYCHKLYKKERKYYNNINLTNLNDNRHFWKLQNHFYQINTLIFKTNLLNKGEVISDDSALAETFSIIENKELRPLQHSVFVLI